MFSFNRLARDLKGIAVIIALMLLINLLPPDTSVSEIRANNTIRACVPSEYPPLITNNPDQPGIDVEILRAVATHIGVNLLLTPVDAMGRDFNPRNWDINRAKCQLIAGGVVDSVLTRSFLDIGPPYAETGWAFVAPMPIDEVDNLTIGALTLVSGLDRIGLASYLRTHDVTVRVVRTRQELIDGILNGEFDGGITEALLASVMAADNDWWISTLPEEVARYNLVIGLWKGDLTLKREVEEAIFQLKEDGTLASILEQYGAAPMGEIATLPAF